MLVCGARCAFDIRVLWHKKSHFDTHDSKDEATATLPLERSLPFNHYHPNQNLHPTGTPRQHTSQPGRNRKNQHVPTCFSESNCAGARRVNANIYTHSHTPKKAPKQHPPHTHIKHENILSESRALSLSLTASVPLENDATTHSSLGDHDDAKHNASVGARNTTAIDAQARAPCLHAVQSISTVRRERNSHTEHAATNSRKHARLADTHVFGKIHVCSPLRSGAKPYTRAYVASISNRIA